MFTEEIELSGLDDKEELSSLSHNKKYSHRFPMLEIE